MSDYTKSQCGTGSVSVGRESKAKPDCQSQHYDWAEPGRKSQHRYRAEVSGPGGVKVSVYSGEIDPFGTEYWNELDASEWPLSSMVRQLVRLSKEQQPTKTLNLYLEPISSRVSLVVARKIENSDSYEIPFGRICAVFEGILGSQSGIEAPELGAQPISLDHVFTSVRFGVRTIRLAGEITFPVSVLMELPL